MRLMAFMALGLVACASEPEAKTVWAGDKSQQEFYTDRAECNAMAGPLDEYEARFIQIFNDCMMGRGWHREPAGTAEQSEADRLMGERAGVHWAVGDGLGSGGCGGPEIAAYMDRMRDRTMARWNTGGLKGQIQIRFRVDPTGNVSNIALVAAAPRELGPSGLDAFRAASPFEPMSDRVRCLSTEDLTATFTVD